MRTIYFAGWQVKEKRNEYFNEVEKRCEVVRKLSVEYNAVLAEFQKAFNKALSKVPAEYWIWTAFAQCLPVMN